MAGQLGTLAPMGVPSMPSDKPFVHLVIESLMRSDVDREWHRLAMRSRSDAMRGLLAYAIDRQPTRAEVDAALDKYRAS